MCQAVCCTSKFLPEQSVALYVEESLPPWWCRGNQSQKTPIGASSWLSLSTDPVYQEGVGGERNLGEANQRERDAPVMLGIRVLLAKHGKAGHQSVTGTQRYVGLEDLQGSAAAWEDRDGKPKHGGS